MTAMEVVLGFDELEDSHSCLDLGFEPASIKEFTFQSGKETLAC